MIRSWKRRLKLTSTDCTCVPIRKAPDLLTRNLRDRNNCREASSFRKYLIYLCSMLFSHESGYLRKAIGLRLVPGSVLVPHRSRDSEKTTAWLWSYDHCAVHFTAPTCTDCVGISTS